LILALYLLAAAFVTLFIVVTINFFWTSNIRDGALRIFAVITISVVVFLLIVIVPFMMMLPDFDDYPVVRKDINFDFYFTQKTYGWVTNLGGKDLCFYKNRQYFFDKKLGEVRVVEETGEFDASIKSIGDTSINLTLEINKKLVLDTVLTTNKYFDLQVSN